jgi:bifunctional non-homologous end joining protein LigD
MANRPVNGQLTLEIDAAPPITALPRLTPMSPVAGPAPFDDDEWFFEPWWPGASAIVYVELGQARLQTEDLADPNAAFPELAGMGGQFAGGRLIVQGTLLVLDENGWPDAELLRRRLAEGRAQHGSAAFVTSDLLWLGSQSLMAQPFADRRAQLTRQLRDGDNCVVSRGLRGEGITLATAAASMGIGEISARRLSGRYRPGIADDAWLRLPVTEAPVPATRPLLTLLQRLPL